MIQQQRGDRLTLTSCVYLHGQLVEDFSRPRVAGGEDADAAAGEQDPVSRRDETGDLHTPDVSCALLKVCNSHG